MTEPDQTSAPKTLGNHVRAPRSLWARFLVWLRRIVIAVVVFAVVLFIIAETVLRFVFGMGNPPLFMPHREIGYQLQPDQDVHRFGNRIKVNRFSMRADDFARTRDSEHETRILFLGDSIINGGNTTDHQELATQIIKKQLAERLEGLVTVGNASAGGWSPGNMLGFLKAHGTFDADVVVLLLSSHDWKSGKIFRPIDDTSRHIQFPIKRPWLGTVEAVNRYLPTLWAIWTFKPKEGEEEYIGLNKPETIHAKDKAVIITESAEPELREIVDLVKAGGSKLIVALHLEFTEQKEGPYPAQKKLQDLFESLDVTVIKLGPAFADWMKYRSNPYKDYIHPNAQGQSIIAAALIAPIQSELTPPPAPGLP